MCLHATLTPMKHRFRITDYHIARGRRLNLCNCPVALCLSEAMGKAIKVDGAYAWIEDHQQSTVVQLPVFLTLWVGRFDACEDVEPIEFELDITAWAMWEDERD